MSCPHCPHCKKKIAQPQQSARPDWQYDLQYLSRRDGPVWPRVLETDPALKNDPDLRYLVEHKYAEPIGAEGFVITELGRKVLAEMRF